MNEVLRHLIGNSEELVSFNVVNKMYNLTQREWQDYADKVKGIEMFALFYPANFS